MKSSFILASIAVFSVSFFAQGVSFAEGNLSECTNEGCIKEFVDNAPDISNPDSFCKVLKGKYHGFFGDDSLEEICHLNVATKKAFSRGSLKCVDDFDLDLSGKTKLVSKFYHNAVFDQIPENIKPPIDCNKNTCGGNTGGTIYDSYNFSTNTHFEEYGNLVPARFKTYMCVAEEGFKRYIPYFYALYVGEGVSQKLYFGYLDKVPFANDPIIQQLIGLDDDKDIYITDEQYKLVDFNSDGFKDLVFFGHEQVGLCLYKKGSSKCDLVKSPKAEFDFMPEIEMNVIVGKSIVVTDTKNKKRYDFIYANKSFKLSESKVTIAEEDDKYRAEVLDYGVYLKKAQVGQGEYSYELSLQTDTILVKKGLLFGFRYKLKGIDIDKDKKEVTIKVVFPPMADPKTKTTTTESSWQDNAYYAYDNFTGWTFGEDWEMVKGNWKIQVLVDNKIVAQKEFVIR